MSENNRVHGDHDEDDDEEDENTSSCINEPIEECEENGHDHDHHHIDEENLKTPTKNNNSNNALSQQQLQSRKKSRKSPKNLIKLCKQETEVEDEEFIEDNEFKENFDNAYENEGNTNNLSNGNIRMAEDLKEQNTNAPVDAFNEDEELIDEE